MSKKEIARSRFAYKEDEGIYVFEDGVSWLAYDHIGDYDSPVYMLHTELDGNDMRTEISTAGIIDSEDRSVFTKAADLLDKLASGWRPINY